jgi:hypothetical protein
MTREREEKRCENCNKLFGPRKLADGRTEYLSQFRKKRHCSKICGAIANAAQRKLVCDAELRA